MGEIITESTGSIIEDKIYVAVGKEVKESKSTVIWAIHKSKGRKICISLVYVPSQTIPMMGADVPVSSVKPDKVKSLRETEKQNILKILDDYFQVCGQMGVRAEKLYIEAESVEKGIVDLISQYEVRELVMGAAADKRCSRRMTELKSKKAIYVRQQASPFCHISFVCNGNLIYTREASTDPIDVDNASVASSDISLPRSQSTTSQDTALTSLPRSQSTTSQDTALTSLPRSQSAISHNNGPIKLTNPVQSFLSTIFSANSEKNGGQSHASPSKCDRGERWRAHSDGGETRQEWERERLSKRSNSQHSLHSSASEGTNYSSYPVLSTTSCEGKEDSNLSKDITADRLSPPSVLDGNIDDNLYDQLEQAITEAENAKREALEEAVRRGKAEKDAIEAIRRARAFENLYSEELKRRREVEERLLKDEEELEKMKKECDDIMEELSRAMDEKSRLESQISETDEVVQELEQKIISAVELLQTYKKERDELQMERDNALREAEELRKRQGDASSSSAGQFFSDFTFSEIEEATGNFDSSVKIGEGGYGSIYKGLLRRTAVAIKLLHSRSLQGPSEFQQEVDVLSKLRHPNLVTLVGACPEAWALIYEFLPNGSLEDRLNCKDNSTPLSWQARIRIVTELCAVLIFLHSTKPHHVVHGDLKPANILLDAHMRCKLSDFGICRLLSRDEHSTNNTTLWRTDPKGTFAYMDPEFISTGELTPKSDIYSFGIILLRLLTARPALGIAKEVQYALSTGNLKDLLDPLAGDWPYVQAEQLAHLALRCCEINRRNRPDLGSDVWKVLEPMRASCGGLSPFRLGSEERCQPPPYFICPILQEVMQDPHVAADGFTYEAEAFRAWLESGHDTSPMTNMELAHTNLVPNRALRSAIQEWLQNH